MVQLPAGEIPDAQWERIQLAVLARGDVAEYPNITLFPDIGEAADVQEELMRLREWLHDEGLLDEGWWG